MPSYYTPRQLAAFADIVNQPQDQGAMLGSEGGTGSFIRNAPPQSFAPIVDEELAKAAARKADLAAKIADFVGPARVGAQSWEMPADVLREAAIRTMSGAPEAATAAAQEAPTMIRALPQAAPAAAPGMLARLAPFARLATSPATIVPQVLLTPSVTGTGDSPPLSPDVLARRQGRVPAGVPITDLGTLGGPYSNAVDLGRLGGNAPTAQVGGGTGKQIAMPPMSIEATPGKRSLPGMEAKERRGKVVDVKAKRRQKAAKALEKAIKGIRDLDLDLE